MVDVFEREHPEVQAAVAFALRSVGEARPSDPIALLAEKLLEYSRTHVRASTPVRPAAVDSGRSSSSAGAGGADEEDAADRARLAAARARGKSKRQAVFSEPVKLDINFVPTIIPKTAEQKAEIVSVISKNFLFRGMDADAERLIVDAMDIKSFSPGDTLIKQGDMGDFYYVLTEGTCEILVNGKKVFEAAKGMGFGELALLYDAPRAATVVAMTDVRAWAVDRMTFKQVMIGTTIRKREVFEAFLQRVPIFSTLTRPELLVIADTLIAEEVAAGTQVIVEGDVSADRFYLVEEGELKAERRGIEGEVCDRLGSGAYFGELSLLTNAPRAATITTCTPCKLLAMDRAAFLRLLGPIEDLLRRNISLYMHYVAT